MWSSVLYREAQKGFLFTNKVMQDFDSASCKWKTL